MSAVEEIKQFCRLLSAYNVVEINAEYDGQGDSGDIYTINAVRQPTPAEIDAVMQNTTAPNASLVQEQHVNLDTWLHNNVFNKKDALITEDQYDNFKDNLFSLLPGGWEIIKNRYGTIAIGVTAEKIQMTHNERITEIRTETFNY